MASRSSKRKPRVLIVDDDPDIREFLGDLLTAWHYVVLTAASGVEALEVLERRQVDVVLLDLVMPTMDGTEALREIRRRRPGLPVIMMSALMTPYLRQQCFQSGAQGCLVKPVDRESLALALFPYLHASSQ